MLQLTLDTSPAAAREVAERLHGLAEQPLPSVDADSVQALLAHGGLLHDLLPTTDGLLRVFLAASSKQELKALRAMVVTRQAVSRATAREFRLLLYATSLLLLGLLCISDCDFRERALAPAAAGRVRACDRRNFDASDRRPTAGDRRSYRPGAR
jgi:hypothetical protein